MQFILAGLLLWTLGAVAEIRVVYVEKRAVTYAATCTNFNTVTLSTLVPTTVLLSTTCTYPTVSGPYVTQNCYGGLLFAACSASTTASACVPSTSTSTLLNIFGQSTGTQLVATSTCTTAIFAPTPTAVPTNAPGVTCYADNVGGVRALTGASTSSSTMTNAVCKTYCNNLGFAYSGTEYSAECFCGNTVPSTASTACTMVCSAAGSNEICGGPNALSVSVNSAIVTTNTQNAALIAAWPAQGCWSDSFPTRVLSGASTTSTSLTVEACITFCNTAGFTLAGLEYGNECYCGNTVRTDGSTYGQSGRTGCNYPCAGRADQICGGSQVLNIYSKTGTVGLTTVSAPSPVPATAAGYTYVNCYSDQGASGRTLTTQKSNVASVDACVTACSSSGFRYAGVEFRGECWCDNSIRGGATVIAGSNCLMACTGTPSQTCGGSNAIQIYTGTASGAIAIPQTASGYTYVDSFTDSVANRVLPNQQILSTTTVANCVTSCSNKGFAYAGLENGSQCWCGASILNSPTPGQTPNSPCTGNSAQLCGGPNVIQIYTGTASPQLLTTPFADGRCVADNTNNVRTLPVNTNPSGSMTPALCKTQCTGYTYYGVEYGSECWCGNAFATGTVLSQSCTMPCSGNSALTCGGSYALNIYNS